MKISILLLACSIHVSASFVFDVSCTAASELCDNMTNSLQIAADMLSEILTIDNAIQVSVSFKSFGPSNTRVLGQSSPASYGFGRTDQSRPFSAYAQALLKQINPNSIYNGPDVVASFNSDFDFYYPSTGEPIGPNQYDFTYVACHELTHGLGFVDDFRSSFSGNVNAINILIPTFYVDASTGTLFEGWAPPNVFNTHMIDYESNENLFTYYEAITTSYTSTGSSLTTLDKDFKNSKIAYNAAEKNLLVSESSSLCFNSMFNSTPVVLYSPKVYSEGSSIAHTDYLTYTRTPDFLMLYTISDFQGVTLNDIIASFNYLGGSVYGPSTFAVMASIGWVTKLNPNSKLSFYEYDANLAGSGDVQPFVIPECDVPSIVDDVIIENVDLATDKIKVEKRSYNLVDYEHNLSGAIYESSSMVRNHKSYLIGR